jgi:nucleoside-diphosphate-sugar epimerase
LKLVVTGATGFIGSNLVQALKTEHSVWAVHRATTDLSALGAPGIEYSGRLESLTEAFEKIQPDCVLHLASLFIAEHKPQEVTPLIESNVLFPAHLLEAMSIAGCRSLINTGTMWQHYNNEEYNPVCLYAATKQAFQDLTRFYVEARNFKVVHLQLSDSYGPKDPRRKLIRILLDAIKNRSALSMSPGEQPLDLVHIDDIVRAYKVALERIPQIESEEVYSITSGRPLELKQLVSTLGQLSGKPLEVEWGGRPYRQREVMHTWNTGKSLPGWSAQVSLEAGLSQLLQEDRQ